MAIPNPRKGPKPSSGQKDEPPVRGPILPDEPENVRSPERPTPRKRPPVNSADDES